MRLVLAFALALPIVAGCTPTIPVRDSFGTSALVPAGDIPPEFAEFNAYDPRVNRLLADQTCATPYRSLAEQTFPATPGNFVQADRRCQDHIPVIGD